MQITFTGRQLEITDALRTYARDKLSRIGKHFDHVIDLQLVLSIEKLEHRAEATLIVSGKKVHADCGGQDMYAALDGLVDKLDRQLLKHKERLTDRGRGEARLAVS